MSEKGKILPIHIEKISLGNKKERDITSDIRKFINSDANLDGQVMVVYGLRRTGKTTAILQVLTSSQQKVAVYEATEGSDIKELREILIKEQEAGTEVICIDEVTKLKDFIDNSAELPDIFAKEGMKIILTGTDSLSFPFAEDDELYERTIRVNTTHIPFAEHSRVLNVNDIDDYIRYGGLMKKGEDGSRVVHDYESARKYLDIAVAQNIINSIKKYPTKTAISHIPDAELTSIIEKLVELYNGHIDEKIINAPLKKATVNFPLDKLKNMVESVEIYHVLRNKEAITKEFAKKINADLKLTVPFDAKCVEELEKYLINMHVLSVTPVDRFYYTKATGWYKSSTEQEYYIVQPAIKYHHLQEAKEFISSSQFYNNLSEKHKEFMQEKLEEKIFGDVMEQVVLFDTKHMLSDDRYMVTKPVFRETETQSPNKNGEYDMLIYDKRKATYWGYEIKHTETPYFGQEKHLINEDFANLLNANFGNKSGVCVLYRGNPFQDNNGVYYLNVNDFMKSVEQYKDIDLVMKMLTEKLPVIDLRRLNQFQENQQALTKADRIAAAKDHKAVIKTPQNDMHQQKKEHNDTPLH